MQTPLNYVRETGDTERVLMKITHTMGSICSNQTKKDLKPPADLSELLLQTEKVKLRV